MLDPDARLPVSAVVAALGALSNQTDSSEVRLVRVRARVSVRASVRFRVGVGVGVGVRAGVEG